MGVQWSQFFPPRPGFTEADIPPLDGKVFLVTGGASGIGYEVARALYQKNARVYIAGRSESKAQKAITSIEQTVPSNKTGRKLEFLQLELDDLSSIKSTVEEFRKREQKLDVLWNNAGVSRPPTGSVSKQDIELQLATNCLGPFLLAQLLLPCLRAVDPTAAADPARIVWVSSQAVELSAPQGGLLMSEVRSPPSDATRLYVNSKTGNIFLATEFARRYGSSQRILSVVCNPGAASTDLFRHTPSVKYLAWPLLHKPELAALTELYAGLSKDVTMEANGCYIIPWGRINTNLRADLLGATKLLEEGGSGRATEFWIFCEEMTAAYY
ncbi:short-chain dehydrogenase [Hypoxylon argillaceum]|nr:short-chain dehydrogenase [Hypoxylon argillaceum]KAI1146447.1 short-chain dehydrogenase [Nemania diffusa]